MGCSSVDEPAATPSVTMQVHGSAYLVDSSIESAVANLMNENVFQATVIELGPAVKIRDEMDTGMVFEGVMTPATVRVDKTYWGDIKEGSEVIIRVFGGVADGLEFMADNAPARETFTKGNQLMMFAGELTATVSEESPALTPHFVYLKQDGLFVDRTYAQGPINGNEVSKISVEELDKKLLAEYSQRD